MGPGNPTERMTQEQPRLSTLDNLKANVGRAKMFVSNLADCDGEATETQVWLDFARDCGYLSEERHKETAAGYDELGRMLSGMITNPAKFAPTKCSTQ